MFQNAFSDRILNHTFLVFTKADCFLDKNSGGLNEYLSTLEGTILWSMFETMENRVIAVENKSEGYKRNLTRQAVLDLLHECVAECYTYKHFLNAQDLFEEQLAEQTKKNEKDRKALHYKISEYVKHQISDENKEGLIRMIKTMPQDVVDRVSEKVKIEGMDPRDVADMANCITKTVLEDCARACLKERIQENLENTITDPRKIAFYNVEILKRNYRVAVDIVGEEFFRAAVIETVCQLKVSCITQFLLANLDLYGDPDEIEERLMRQYGAAFVGGNTIKLMTECMDSEEVRMCISTFSAKKAEIKELVEKLQAGDNMMTRLQQQMVMSEQGMKQREQEMKKQMDCERKAAKNRLEAEKKHIVEIKQQLEKSHAEKLRNEEQIKQIKSESDVKIRELQRSIQELGGRQ